VNWKMLDGQTGIDDFMDLFGGFHDSCLKELQMWSGTFVNENLSMTVSTGLDTCVRILFQRQVEETSAIELLFKGVMQFHIIPHPEGGDSIIYGAKLEVKDGVFYWAGDQEWQMDQPFLHPVSWISAKEIHWRDVSLWIGEEQRYGVLENDKKR